MKAERKSCWRRLVFGSLLGSIAWSGVAAQANADSSLPREVAVTLSSPISLHFQNIDIRTLLQVFADFTGLNLVATDSVSGQVTVRLTEVPWSQALQIVLQSKGLASRQDGRVLWVAPQEEWALREKKQLEAQAALESVSPLQMLTVRLQYARAAEVAQRLQGGSPGSGGAGRWLSSRGSVMAEPRTNQLFISDLPARLSDVQKLLAQLDVPVRQVLIEARIVEADDQFGQSLGVHAGALAHEQPGQYAGLGSHQFSDCGWGDRRQSSQFSGGLGGADTQCPGQLCRVLVQCGR